MRATLRACDASHSRAQLARTPPTASPPARPGQDRNMIRGRATREMRHTCDPNSAPRGPGAPAYLALAPGAYQALWHLGILPAAREAWRVRVLNHAGVQHVQGGVCMRNAVCELSAGVGGMCVCVCVCMCVCVHVCVHVNVCVHVHVCVNVCVCSGCGGGRPGALVRLTLLKSNWPFSARKAKEVV